MAAGGRQEVIRVLKASQQLLEDTLLRNGAAVAEGLDKVHGRPHPYWLIMMKILSAVPQAAQLCD